MLINMPCLKYIAYLPNPEDRLYVFINNLSKQGYPIEYIKSLGLGEYADILKASSDDFNYKKVAYSCRNVAKQRLSSVGFKDKLCMSCFYYNKCQNFKREAEYKALKYLIETYPDKEYELSVDEFKALEVYYYEENNALSFALIELSKEVFKLIQEAYFKEIDGKDKLIRFIEDSLSDLVRKDNPSSACDYVSRIFKENILDLDSATKEDLDSLKEPVNSKILATEYRKDMVNKAVISAPITDDDLFEVPIQMQRQVSKSEKKEPLNTDITYADNMKKGIEVFDLNGLLNMYKDADNDNSSAADDSNIGNTDNKQGSLSDDNEDTNNVENREDDLRDKDSTQLEETTSDESLKDEPDNETCDVETTSSRADDDAISYNFNSPFNNNGELVLNINKVNEDYIITDRTNILNLLGILKNDEIVAIEAAIFDNIKGLFVKSKSLKVPFFINDEHINEYVISEFFTSKRCILVSSNACMLTKYLVRYNRLNGASIKSLAAVYNALNETRIIAPVDECLSYIGYTIGSDNNMIFDFMDSYKMAFDRIKLDLLRKEKGRLYSINLDYEMALGTARNLPDYFKTDDENLAREDFIRAAFAYNGMYKKRSHGMVFSYEFYDEITHEMGSMELTKRVVVSIFKDDFLRQFKLVFLSIVNGKIAIFSPLEGKKNEALINEKVIQIIQKWYQKFKLNIPHIDIES